jgi:hypothetical protein
LELALLSRNVRLVERDVPGKNWLPDAIALNGREEAVPRVANWFMFLSISRWVPLFPK